MDTNPNKTTLILADEWTTKWCKDEESIINDYFSAIQINALKAAAAVAESVAHEEDTRLDGISTSYSYQIGCRNTAQAILSLVKQLEEKK